jgi:hypothetical protein
MSYAKTKTMESGNPALVGNIELMTKKTITRNCTQYSLIWRVFAFCTCCILICLACIVASFKLSCV